MLDQTLLFFDALLAQTGAVHLSWGNVVMILVGATLVYLALA